MKDGAQAKARKIQLTLNDRTVNKTYILVLIKLRLAHYVPSDLLASNRSRPKSFFCVMLPVVYRDSKTAAGKSWASNCAIGDNPFYSVCYVVCHRAPSFFLFLFLFFLDCNEAPHSQCYPASDRYRSQTESSLPRCNLH